MLHLQNRGPLKYISYMEDNHLPQVSQLPPPEKSNSDAHELYQSMIDKIILSLQSVVI
jgi:hypothetical protein